MFNDFNERKNSPVGYAAVRQNGEESVQGVEERVDENGRLRGEGQPPTQANRIENLIKKLQ